MLKFITVVLSKEFRITFLFEVELLNIIIGFVAYIRLFRLIVDTCTRILTFFITFCI